jgi:hypothetical protein
VPVREEEIAVTAMQVKMRRMPEQQDTAVSLMNTSSVEELKSVYRTLCPSLPEEFRLFFGGRELKNECTLIECGVKSEFVIQVFARK